MRKNWTKNEDGVLRRVVGQIGINDWTAVANLLKERFQKVERTGKQCRERWYNHLDPSVNKQQWSYEQEIMLFQTHRQMGNKWKQISQLFKGRTDNNIKNHFYSALRRSLRRLNKVIGEKNSTLQMREIKPSVLTIILNFIYDHEHDKYNYRNGQLINQLKDLPKLIFQFAQFKPVKGNMSESIKEANKSKIQTIFKLIEQFKSSYYQEKHNDVQKDEEKYSEKDEYEQILSAPLHPLARQIDFSQFKAQEKTVNVIIHSAKEEEALQSTQIKADPSDRQRDVSVDKFNLDEDNHQQMMELQEPSPLTYINDGNRYADLVVIGKHMSPKRQYVQEPDIVIDIDQVLYMSYN